MGVHQETHEPSYSEVASVSGFCKPKYWWRRRDSNPRPRAYEFWGMTFAEIPRRAYLGARRQKLTHPALGDRSRTVADKLKWVHKRAQGLVDTWTCCDFVSME